jgi:hypothetical protein
MMLHTDTSGSDISPLGSTACTNPACTAPQQCAKITRASTSALACMTPVECGSTVHSNMLTVPLPLLQQLMQCQATCVRSYSSVYCIGNSVVFVPAVHVT